MKRHFIKLTGILFIFLISGCWQLLNIQFPFPLQTENGTIVIACEFDKHCYTTETCNKKLLLCFVKCHSVKDCVEYKNPCREMEGIKVCHLCINGEKCLKNETCHKDVCRKKCSSDAECQQDFDCKNGLCLPIIQPERQNEINNTENITDGGISKD